MKKNVIVFGLIAGLIVSVVMLTAVIACYNNPDFTGSMVVGFLSMFVAFSFIYVGVKNYRDKYNGGQITFGKAFSMGLYIALVASTMYVVTWLFTYYLFIPDFMDKYVAHVIKDTQASGATAAELAQTRADMAIQAERYKNPVFVVMYTYMEILPVGILVALVSAFLLKRKNTVVAS
ncbi:DUF4199 domain-containing protein [Mucilaginibacter hurinus]|uniref:DUF4199 domain-containing protein n=1 Tax=Mucilaginibacter hurinus TaxID=2201324 RepID=A0A367GU33_9SPHI|nr:DUF4199 domain-containing protein [Mucilaginibacter hurinus]RCH56213.1 DUF4199 domain-containing protein [Mucilaginibacter hurinus]